MMSRLVGLPGWEAALLLHLLPWLLASRVASPGSPPKPQMATLGRVTGPAPDGTNGGVGTGPGRSWEVRSSVNRLRTGPTRLRGS